MEVALVFLLNNILGITSGIDFFKKLLPKSEICPIMY